MIHDDSWWLLYGHYGINDGYYMFILGFMMAASLIGDKYNLRHDWRKLLQIFVRNLIVFRSSFPPKKKINRKWLLYG